MPSRPRRSDEAELMSACPPIAGQKRTCPWVRVGSDSDLDAPEREVRFAPIDGHLQLGAARPKSATNRRCRRAYIVTKLPWLGRQPSHGRDSAPVIFSERDWN